MRKIYVVVGVVVLGVLVLCGYLLSKGVLKLNTSETPGTPAELATTTETIASSTENVESATDTDSVPMPLLMALDMETWEWERAEFADGQVLTPTKARAFTLAFGGSGTVEIGTDCNSMSSTYEAYNGNLTFGPITATEMFCEGSQEGEFSAPLERFATYQFTGKGELIVKTNDDIKVIFK